MTEEEQDPVWDDPKEAFCVLAAFDQMPGYYAVKDYTANKGVHYDVVRIEVDWTGCNGKRLHVIDTRSGTVGEALTAALAVPWHDDAWNSYSPEHFDIMCRMGRVVLLQLVRNWSDPGTSFLKSLFFAVSSVKRSWTGSLLDDLMHVQPMMEPAPEICYMNTALKPVDP